MKSEKEKMLAGELDFASDAELSKDREYARNLLFEFNNSKPSEKEKRQEILSRLISAKGSFHIEAPFYCDYGYNINIGKSLKLK